MTKEEYIQLKRFRPAQARPLPASFRVGDIFKAYTIADRMVYICITAAIDGMMYDVKECDRLGRPVRLPYKRAGVRHYEILNRLADNDWRLLKTTKR